MFKLKDDTSSRHSADNLLKRSVISEGFEQLKVVPKNNVNERHLKMKRKVEREKTKGSDWFNMPATKKTDDIRKDLEVLQMRSAMDPKRFYKKNDLKTLPKYFQVGRVVDSPADYYSSRIPKKQRKRTIVDELIADQQFKNYTKRKYIEVLKSDPKRRRRARAYTKKVKNSRSI